MYRTVLAALLVLCHVCDPRAKAEPAFLPYVDLSSDDAGTLPREDDGDSGAIILPSHLPFKQSNQTTAFVGTNGFVSFGSAYKGLTRNRDLFPDLDRFLVAPYWADIDLRLTGRVAYKVIDTSSNSNNKVLQNVNQFLAQNQTLKFTATWGLVASWEETCPFQLDRQCTNTKPNTFQVVIVTDGVYSYAVVIFKCGDLNWTGLSDFAVVGFLAGQGVHGNHSLSMTPDVNSISCLNLPSTNWSNVVFRLSQEGAPLRIMISAAASDRLLAVVGDNIDIVFSLDGAEPQQIEWKFTAVNGSMTNISFPQQTLNESSLVLHLSNVLIQEAGTYTVTVFTKGNSDTASVELAVQVPPVAVNSSIPERANKGDTTLFTCSFFGYPIPDVVIMKDGSAIPTLPRFNVTTSPTPLSMSGSGTIDLIPSSNQGSEVTSSLIISDLEISDTGLYSCLATNQLESIRQSNISSFLAVYDPALILSSSPNLTVNETNSVSLHCRAIGFPAPNITWSVVHSGNSTATILTDVLIEETTMADGTVVIETRIVLPSVHLNNGGVYMCRAANTVPGTGDSIGIDTSSFSLTVQTVPVVNAATEHTIVGLVGHNITVGFVVERDNPSVLPEGVEWMINGFPLNLTDKRYSFSPDYLMLTVFPLRKSDEGQYQVMIRNAAGVNSATIDLDVQFPPTITTDPSSRTVLSGDSITLSCPSSADPPPATVWAFTNATITHLVILQNATTVSLSNITTANAGLYTCTTYNVHGNDSASAAVQVQVPAQLTIVPQSRVEGVAGGSMNISCQAVGYPTPNITWYKDNIILKESDIPNVSNHQSVIGMKRTSQLVFNHLLLENSREYACQASNHLAIPVSHRSNSTTLFVLYPPSINVTSPQVAVKEFSSVVLACSGFGVPLPQLRWRRTDSQPLAGEINETVVTGSDGRRQALLQLRLDNVSDTDSGHFVCSGENNVTNLIGSQEQDAVTLTVLIVPVLRRLTDYSVPLVLQRNTAHTQNITLGFAVVRATPSILPQNVTWFFNSSSTPLTTQLLSPHQRVRFSSDRFSVTLLNVMVANAGWYTVKVDNGIGTVEETVRLAITAEPRLTSDGGPIVVTENEKVTFECSAAGVPLPTIIWLKNGQPIDDRASDRISITSELLSPNSEGLLQRRSMLSISQALFRTDEGRYLCKAANGAGQPATQSNPFQLSVTQPPPRQFCAEAGQPCKNGGTCVNTKEKYICQCTRNYYGRTCEIRVVIQTEPQFTTQPQNTSRQLYSTLTLACSASGIPTPRLTWYKDMQLVTDSDGDDTVFTIRELRLQDRGFYQCKAENSYGAKTSLVAVVNIDNVIQYEALMVVPKDNPKPFTMVVKDTNEIVAGSIITSNTSLFFIELSNNIERSSNTSRMAAVIITIITEEGGSERLLQQVQQGLRSLHLSQQVSFSVEERFDGCPQAVSILSSPSNDPDLEMRLFWPETNIGEIVVLPCPCGTVTLGAGNLQATRYCGGNFSVGAQWETEESSACDFSDRARKICNLAMLEVEDRVNRLKEETETVEEFEAADVSVAAAVLVDSASAFGSNTTLLEGFFTVGDNLLNVNASTMRESQKQANTSARMLATMEAVTGELPVEDDGSLVIVRKNFAVSVQSITKDQFHGVMFTASENGGISIAETRASATEIDSSVRLSITLPGSLLEAASGERGNVKITNAVFNNDNLFQTGQENLIVDGRIIAASVRNRTSILPVRDLNTPVMLVLPRERMLRNSSTRAPMCVFWNFEAADGLGDWSTGGCRLTRDNETEDFAVCECDHLTNFALLLDVSPQPPNRTNDAVGIALTAVSYIGVIVSIFCLIATIVTYTASKPLRSTDHGKLLLNLCFGLLGLYFSYILAIHGTAVPALCAIFAILLHYFFLATFVAMAVEAINLYMKLVVVLGSQISHYTLKAVLITWILPGVVVIFCFAPNPSNYIGSHFCRVFGIPFYIGLLVPFIIIYLFNWVMFSIIIFNLICKDCKTKYKESKSKDKKMSIRQQLIITATLSILFGLGWGIGLPATQELHQTPAVRDTFAAFFILLTAFQGLFIFLMHCLRSKEARKLWSQWIFKTTGKEVDLTLSTNAGSLNYWKKRRHSKPYNSEASHGTSVTYASTSGTLKRNVEIHRDMGSFSMAPLESPTVPDLEFDVKVSTPFDNTSQGLDSDRDDVFPEVVVVAEASRNSPDHTSREVESSPTDETPNHAATVDLERGDSTRSSKSSSTTERESCQAVTSTNQTSDSEQVKKEAESEMKEEKEEAKEEVKEEEQEKAKKKQEKAKDEEEETEKKEKAKEEEMKKKDEEKTKGEDEQDREHTTIVDKQVNKSSENDEEKSSTTPSEQQRESASSTDTTQHLPATDSKEVTSNEMHTLTEEHTESSEDIQHTPIDREVTSNGLHVSIPASDESTTATKHTPNGTAVCSNISHSSDS